MGIMNLKMFELLLTQLNRSKLVLDSSLEKMLETGFVTIDGCSFLGELYNKQRHYSRVDFQDNTGYECFVNSFHVDDYCESDHLIQAFLFSQDLLKKWIGSYPKEKLKIIISQTEYGFNVKFHISRVDENYIDENALQKFEEPILIVSV